MKKYLMAIVLVMAAGNGYGVDTATGQYPDGGKLAPLFNGKDLSEFEILNGTATYRVEDGVIIGTSKKGSPNTFLCTKAKYGNFVLEYEFKAHPEMNSGVQFRSESLPEVNKGRVHGYQVEIDPAQSPHVASNGRVANLDEKGKEVTGQPRSWTGGIYDEARRGWLNDLSKNPAARKAFKPGAEQWNHIRLEAIGSHIRTWVNGVAAADLKDDLTPAGFIAFQVHATGNDTPMEVCWRAIRILDLDRADPVARALTGGKLADNWQTPTNKWVMAGEAMTHPQMENRLAWKEGAGVMVNGEQGSTSNLVSKEQFGDVQLHVEFMVPQGSNSGVYLMGRYEIQVFDSFGKAPVEYSDCGGIYQRWNETGNPQGYEGRPPLVNASTAPGTWQSYDISFRAPRFDKDGKKTENARFLMVVHNGRLIQKNQEVTGPTRAAMFADNDEKPLGPLMLQGDHGPVAYRNIRIKKAELE